MNRFVQHLLMILITVITLTACQSTPKTGEAVVPPVDPEQVFDRNQDRLSNLSSWHFDGRFSIKSRQHAESASISWLQQQQDYLLKISGPLNQGTIFLRGNPNNISYKDSKGNVDSAETPEALLSRHTDYQLPIVSLRYWVLGRPDPHFAYDMNIDDMGNMKTLTQHGWQIKYELFTTHDRYQLPTKLIMKHPDLSITLSIHEWNANLSPH